MIRILKEFGGISKGFFDPKWEEKQAVGVNGAS
jgi:hypothetical protein